MGVSSNSSVQTLIAIQAFFAPTGNHKKKVLSSHIGGDINKKIRTGHLLAIGVITAHNTGGLIFHKTGHGGKRP
jgi:hypothetical protein